MTLEVKTLDFEGKVGKFQVRISILKKQIYIAEGETWSGEKQVPRFLLKFYRFEVKVWRLRLQLKALKQNNADVRT